MTPPTHFVVTAPSSASAGTPLTFTVTVEDAGGDVVTGYTGTVRFTSSDAAATLPAASTLTNGTGTFNATLNTAGTQTITATDSTTSSLTGTSGTITVSGATTHLVVTAPSAASAGTPISLTVTAEGAGGAVVTSYTGTVRFSSSDPAATLPAASTLTNGTGTFGATLNTGGIQTITATDAATASITGSAEVEVAGAVTHFAVSAPTSVSAGTPFNLTVTAEDAHDFTVASYAGTVEFTSTDPDAALPAASTLTNGTGTFSATLDTAGIQTITATDATTTSVTGAAEVEVTGAATHYAVSAPATTTAGTPFSFTVTAEDANDLEVTSYAGTIDFTSSDPDAVLPAASTLTDGTGTYTATLITTGTQTITATDATTSITGSAEIDVPEKPLTQLSGIDRIATAIAVSQASFGQSEAGAVVLARDDAFADALTGGPLAAAHDAPLLLTGPTSLDPRVGAEMRRVLTPGGTVYLLGGTAALSGTVEAAVIQLGFKSVRLAGADRFGTAVQIATAGLGSPQTVLLVTGEDFADALAATPAASKLGAAILLTEGATMPFTTSAYLAAHASQVYALGGPAAGADTTATAIVGGDRFQTAALVAARWFASATVVGFASGASFPDGLAGGADMARLGGPMLLLDPTQSSLPPLVASYLSSVQADVQSANAFGGPAALPPGLIAAAQAAL